MEILDAIRAEAKEILKGNDVERIPCARALLDVLGWGEDQQ